MALTALAVGVLVSGCAPAPGGGPGSAPEAGGGGSSQSGPDQSGPDQSGPDQSGPEQSGPDQSGSGQSGSPSSGSSSASKIVLKTGLKNAASDVKPKEVAISSTGGNQLSDVTWSSWGSKKAVGKGTLKLDTCDPSCAGGGQHVFNNATITLTMPKTYDGEKQYTRFTVTAPGMTPKERNAWKFRPTNTTVEDAEGQNEIYVDQSVGQPKPEQRPVEFSAGGVGHMRVEDVDWTSWDGPTAVGNGTLKIDRCDPACANGGVDTYSNATVKLTDVKNVGGRKQYTKYTMTAPGLPADIARELADQPIEDD